MKIIFLDVDWVLVTWFDWKNPSQEFNENCVNLLKNLIARTWAKIVISSSRRHYLGDLKRSWLEAWLDLELIIGVTPSRTWWWRDGEISQWIEWNLPNIIPLTRIAIDDEHFNMNRTDALWKLVRTNLNEWITRKILDLCIQKLNS